MRRITTIAAIALVVLTSCGGNSSSTDTSVVEAPQGKCVPTEKNPFLGLAAITQDFRVHVWTNPNSLKPTVLEKIGEFPFEGNDGLHYSPVESAVISSKDCSIFVGTCCEPVSGITYYRGKETGEWLQLFGRLPEVSPDGELLAIHSYEKLLISSTNEPSIVITEINLPPADEVWVERVKWINGDEVAVSGAKKDGMYVWIARMSDGTLREAFRITKDINQGTGAISGVGFVGTDEMGNIVTQSVTVGERGVNSQFLEYRYLDTYQTFSTTPLPVNAIHYRMSLGRTSFTRAQVLSVWFGNGDPQTVNGQYVWAG